MITLFRMSKNKYLREKQNYEVYWKHVLLNLSWFLETYFLDYYNVRLLDSRNIRLSNFERFVDDLLNSENIDCFIRDRMNVEEIDNAFILNNGEFRLFIFCYNEYISILNELKLAKNKKQLMACFNLTPIREPYI